MTVIAWDGTTLAADRRCTYGTEITTGCKIGRVGDVLFAAHGGAGSVAFVREWLANGCPDVDFPKVNNEDVPKFMLIYRDGTVKRFDGTRFGYSVLDAHVTAGSGGEFARAALYMGADAVRAVEVASALCCGCGNGVDTLTFEDA